MPTKLPKHKIHTTRQHWTIGQAAVKSQEGMLGSGSRYHSLVPHTHMAGVWTAEIEPAEFKNPETVSPRALLPAGTHNPLLGPHIYKVLQVMFVAHVKMLCKWLPIMAFARSF